MMGAIPSRSISQFHGQVSTRGAWGLRQFWSRSRFETDQGHRCHLSFYDAARLQQEVAYAFVEQHALCFAEPGLVTIPEVTLTTIQQCLRHLEDTGYFDNLAAQ